MARLCSVPLGARVLREQGGLTRAADTDIGVACKMSSARARSDVSLLDSYRSTDVLLKYLGRGNRSRFRDNGPAMDVARLFRPRALQFLINGTVQGFNRIYYFILSDVKSNISVSLLISLSN